MATTGFVEGSDNGAEVARSRRGRAAGLQRGFITRKKVRRAADSNGGGAGVVGRCYWGCPAQPRTMKAADDVAAFGVAYDAVICIVMVKVQ